MDVSPYGSFQKVIFIRFLDAIASLDLGYESESVCVIKPNNAYNALHWIAIEFTLNTHWMYIEYPLNVQLP